MLYRHNTIGEGLPLNREPRGTHKLRDLDQGARDHGQRAFVHGLLRGQRTLGVGGRLFQQPELAQPTCALRSTLKY